MEREIKIVNSNSADGTLELNPKETLYVDKGDKVIWSISASKVESFRIQRKNLSEDVFESKEPPPFKHVKKGGGRIKKKVKADVIYEYSIFWKQFDDEREYEFDPKIAINPDVVGFRGGQKPEKRP